MDNPVYRNHLDGASIRLLRISSSHDGGFIGKFKVFRLSETPPFFTASYTWGEQTYSETPIRLKTASLPVLQSLAPFLRMISTHDDFDDKDWWWIDSLSIDLQNAQERERQIAIMAEIYKKSKRAVVWLGQPKEDGSDCTGAIEFLEYLSGVQRKLTTQSARSTLRGPQFAAEWAAVSNLLARPWWTRVWTLQEFILPREAKIYCGTSTISRGAFKSAMYSIFLCSTSGRDMAHELVPRPVFDTAFNRRRIHQWYRDPQTRGMNLVAILAYLGNHSATDSRDRIYSVLGLITARDRKLVGDPEYSSSVQHQYARLVRSFWNEYQSLDIICFAHLFNRYSTAIDPGPEHATPSWTPDWRMHNEFASPVPLMASQSASEHIGNFRPLSSHKWKAIYDAPGKQLRRRANVRFHDNLKEMWCDGVVVDTIDALGSLEGCDPRCYSFVCARDEPKHGALHSRRSADPDLPTNFLGLLDAIARSLVLDRQDKYLRFQSPPHYVSDFLALCHACLENEHVDPCFAMWFQSNRTLRIGTQTLESLITAITSSTGPSLFDSLPPPTLSLASTTIYPPNTAPNAEVDDADTFLTRFQDTVRKKSRRLMTTDQGYVGMAPCQARLGDAVVVLFACSIPLVLRRTSVREAWQVVGEAYMHGFMNGEASKMPQAKSRNSKRFRII